MRGTDVFPSNYIKAADLQGRQVRVLMANVEMEKIGDDEKPVLYFHGKEKGLVLNRTNWNNIALAYGDESDEWEGKTLVLFPATTDFQGRTVDCVRVRPAPGKAVANKPAPKKQEPPPADPEDYGAQ